MPIYDFECAHHHVFELTVPMAERRNPVPCQGKVNQIIPDEEMAAAEAAGELEWEVLAEDLRIAVRKVPCILQAHMIVTHGHPNAMLDHGFARNREAAMKGTYDPNRPATNVMAKGREWRK